MTYICLLQGGITSVENSVTHTAETKAAYRVILGDTLVTSVHVLFDEAIPEKSADYLRELDEATDNEKF